MRNLFQVGFSFLYYYRYLLIMKITKSKQYNRYGNLFKKV